MGFREALSQREGGLGRDNNIQCVDITSTSPGPRELILLLMVMELGLREGTGPRSVQVL